MHEDFVLLNVDMSSAFSVVASGGSALTTPKSHEVKADNGVLRPEIVPAGPYYL